MIWGKFDSRKVSSNNTKVTELSCLHNWKSYTMYDHLWKQPSHDSFQTFDLGLVGGFMIEQPSLKIVCMLVLAYCGRQLTCICCRFLRLFLVPVPVWAWFQWSASGRGSSGIFQDLPAMEPSRRGEKRNGVFQKIKVWNPYSRVCEYLPIQGSFSSEFWRFWHKLLSSLNPLLY